jgi:3-dehydroquinate dehydratase-2
LGDEREDAMKILVINGPNLNLLGVREPDIYGAQTLRDLEEMIRAHCVQIGAEVSFFQSNHEGAIVDAIQGAYGNIDAMVINPAAYTHTSVAIPDAIKAVGIPAVEVHLSDIENREPFRRHSYTRDACVATIAGKHFVGYIEAIERLRGEM